MADSNPDAGRHRSPKRFRFVPLAWVSGLIAATLLVLGASGTLSSWTAAILNNNTNTVATGSSVVLQEKVTSSSTINADCVSSTGGFVNTSTCTEINKYGGVASPLVPVTNPSQTTSETFTNVGTGAASKFKLTPGTCTQSPVAGTGTPAVPANLCSSAASDLNLTLACYDGSTIPGTGAYTDLAYNGNLGAFSAVLTHTATIAAGASISCKFTITLSATANPADGGITVAQPLTWELDV